MMTGKEFFEKMEAAFPGFLKAAYGNFVFSKEADELTAIHIEHFAKHCGCDRLTGPMVEHARQALGMVRKRPQAPLLPAPEPVAAAVEVPVLPLEADVIGLLVSLGRKLDTLNGEVGALARRVRELEDPPIGIPAPPRYGPSPVPWRDGPGLPAPGSAPEAQEVTGD